MNGRLSNKYVHGKYDSVQHNLSQHYLGHTVSVFCYNSASNQKVINSLKLS